MLEELLMIAAVPAVYAAWRELMGEIEKDETLSDDGMTYYEFCREIQMGL